MRLNNKLVYGLTSAAFFALAGCSAFTPVPDVAEKPLEVSSAFRVGAEAALDVDWDADSSFVIKRAESAVANLPKVMLKNVTFSETGIYDTLRLVAAQAGLTLRIEGGTTGAERYGPVTMENVSGPFSQVLQEMADAAGFFWEMKGNTLIVRQDDQFIINVPPVLAEDTLAGISNTVRHLGGREVYLDRANKQIVFFATRKGLDQISRYLDHVRATRSLLIYDTHIFQVTLNDGLDTGIQWNSFKFDRTATKTNGGVTTGTGTKSTSGLGLVLGGDRFSIDMLFNFLKTQGTVKSLSQPQIVMLSGSKGSLRVGNTHQFVSKVGTNYTSSVNQVTTETTSLRTGLSLALQGDVYDKTVFTRVQLALSEITEMGKFTALGTDLTLPQSADRDLDVSVRARPGDVLLLGGIHTQSDNNTDKAGLSMLSKGWSKTRTELVLVMKTRVIRFTKKSTQMTATQFGDDVKE